MYQKNGNILQLYLSEAQKSDDRNIFEESFKDFVKENVLTEKEMIKKIRKYG